MNRKAQQSRNDMAIIYAASLLVMILAVGTLYSFGIIGNSGHNSLIDNSITAASVTESKQGQQESSPLQISSENTTNQSAISSDS